MFNRGKFNLKQFNLPEKPTDIQIRGEQSATVESSARLDHNIYLSVSTTEEIGGQLQIAAKVTATAGGVETIGASCAAVDDYHFGAAPEDALAAFVKATANCHAVGAMAEALGVALNVGENAYIKGDISDGIAFDGAIGTKYAAAEIAAYEIVNCLVSSAVFDTIYITLDVTIPAGGKLVLDSENFLALLNDENVLDKHDGDWVELNRNVEEIKIDGGGTTTLSATMLYTERYL